MPHMGKSCEKGKARDPKIAMRCREVLGPELSKLEQGCSSHVVPAAINEWLIAGVVRDAITLNCHLWTSMLAIRPLRVIHKIDCWCRGQVIANVRKLTS